MPAFIKTEKDERIWSRAKRLVHASHPKLSEDNDKFWALTNSIYQKLRGKKMEKAASQKVLNAMRKLAYVPLTPAAQEAMAGQPPMDPAMDQGMSQMPPQGGMPMDPAMQGQPPMQPVPGPNGEPIDPETGFIIVDPANGIEQDPLTGILFVKPTGEFMTPDGQPIPPDQAQAMIEAAMQQMMQQGGAPGAMPPEAVGMLPPGGDPAAMGGMSPEMLGGQPPMDPAMAQGMPMDPSTMQQMPPPPPPMDPAAQMASGGPVIDDQTGLPIDPNTGMFVQGPAAQAEAPTGAQDAGLEGGLGEAMPGFEQFVDQYNKTMERQDKLNRRLLHDISGARTDIQGVRREFQQFNDNYDTLLARLENVLQILEQVAGTRG